MKSTVLKMDKWLEQIELMAIKKAAFDAIPYPIWVKKYDEEKGLFVMIFINKAYTDFTGIEYNEYVGKTDFDIHQESIAEEYHNNDLDVYLSGEPMCDFETFHGETYPTSKALYRLQDKKYGIIGSMMISEKFKK